MLRQTVKEYLRKQGIVSLLSTGSASDASLLRQENGHWFILRACVALVHLYASTPTRSVGRIASRARLELEVGFYAPLTDKTLCFTVNRLLDDLDAKQESGSISPPCCDCMPVELSHAGMMDFYSRKI